ncbi:speckle-type POZ protein B-like [Microplitis mediator]|uniref:speckle-type POZ protein B-like n=1 Tax=Microplitis mediator TaxID=375433 RepID=UPI00255337D5|nr:speckle-type POZ protein B-like [Microplitis mediator]
MEILGYSNSQKRRVIYKWKINEIIPFIESAENSDVEIIRLNSSKFTTNENNEISWHLQLQLLRVKGWITLFLFQNDGEEEIRIKFTLFMLDSKNERQFVETACGNGDFKSGCGFDEFLEIKKLLENKDDFLPNNTLTIGVELTVYEDYESLTTEYPLPKRQRQMTDDFKELYDSKINSDVIFVVGNQKFNAHKIILSARSPVFLAMFTHEMKEKRDNEVTIPDIEPEIFNKLLEFIYTDDINNLDMDAASLLEAANKYQLLKLKSLCEESLFKSASINNAIELMILADLHNANQLFERVLELIIKNIEDVIETPEYKILEASQPLLLSKLIKKLATSMKFNASKDKK